MIERRGMRFHEERDPEHVVDNDGDVWTKAEDGFYFLGTGHRQSGETTLGHIRRNYGIAD